MIKFKHKKYVLGLITYTKLNGMNFKLIRFIILSISVLFSTYLSAQKSPKDEYRAEIGVTGGGNFYIGETNSQLFSNMRISYSGFVRYRINPRFALRAELTSATVAGSGIHDNPVYVGDFCGEFNFFELEYNQYKRYSKTFSPYLFLGVGMLTDVFSNQKLPVIGLPFGVGMKIKLNKRWNLNAQWANRLLLSDNLENNPLYDNPNHLNGTNIFNNDLLSTFTIGVSYDVWKKQCDCMSNYRK
jgi:hypothetical protein